MWRKKPGYSGVDNPHYDNEKTIKLPGDARLTAKRLIDPFQAEER
ncbi:hypothetical protein [Desulfosarcina variabilis]